MSLEKQQRDYAVKIGFEYLLGFIHPDQLENELEEMADRASMTVDEFHCHIKTALLDDMGETIDHKPEQVQLFMELQ
jgi:ATP/maltotriose-dependent transcriptional regulator MalT